MDLDTLGQQELDALGAVELRALAAQLIERAQADRAAMVWRDARIAQLTAEMATLKRVRFGAKSERLDASQRALFEEAFDADLAALEAQVEALRKAVPQAKTPSSARARREPLPSNLPRIEIAHEPENTTCPCGCAMQRVGEDIAEKLDYAPGVFTVERHVRGKWACRSCRTLVQAPVPAQIIDKGIPTAGLLAQVLVAKASDHLPLYRQEAIFGRAGLAIPRSTLAAWFGAAGTQLLPVVAALKRHLFTCGVLQADETPVSVLDPGAGKTRKAYLWAYAAGVFEPIRAVVYDFAETRAGVHARAFLGYREDSDGGDVGAWRGTLVCDDYSAYDALFAKGVIEAGCMAHARRKFVDLHLSQASTIAETAIDQIRLLYEIERAAKDLMPEHRLRMRKAMATPIATHLHAWLVEQRARVPDGGGIARAIDYSLKRWSGLTRYLSDPALPIDNNHDEQQIRPWATGRKNWLFAGTLAAGKRLAAVMSLVQSAKLNGHDPYAYLKDVLTRLPQTKDRDIDQLLPHLWIPSR
ncbi:MAG: IS66 family transposase [Thauera sp.]|nr:IS66 family transposase [Thauera sp.]